MNITTLADANGALTNWAIQKAMRLCDRDTITKLEEFFNKQSELENDYKQYALNFIRSTLQLNQSGDTKKGLTNLLLGLGFKKANVSKMIEATRFTVQLEREKSAATDWVKTLPVSTTYVLATCSEKAFSKIWAEESKWGAEKVSRETILKMKQKYEPSVQGTKVSPETNSVIDRGGAPHHNSNLLKARKLLSDYPGLVKQIDALIEQSGAVLRTTQKEAN